MPVWLTNMLAHSKAVGQMQMMSAFVMAGFIVLFLVHQSVVLAIGMLLFAGFLGLMLRWPDMGTLAVLFAIYSNISVLAMRSQKAVQLTAGPVDKNPRVAVVLAGLFFLLIVPLIFHLFIRKQKLIFDHGFILMLVLLVVYLTSSLFATDKRIVVSHMSGYVVEGLMLYFLITNVIRDASTVKRVTWTLLLAGNLMAGLSVFQKVTHTESNIYGGLAQVSSDFELDTSRQVVRNASVGPNGEAVGEVRAAGPIGETNRYGQILVVLLPLGVLRFVTESSRRLRAFALVSVALIFGALCLTLSRGSILAALAVFVLMAGMRVLKVRQVVVAAVCIGLFVVVAEPAVLSRMASLERLKGLFVRQPAAAETPDSSAVRRYVLNVATWHVFLDHPLLGVGPGQFSEHYSAVYGNRVGLIEQRKTYRGHNLYLETLAETGVIGLLSFLAMLFVIMRGLWKVRTRLMKTRPDLAATAAALFLCLAAYAISAVFDHLAYQRYYWLLLAISSATIRIVQSMEKNELSTEPCLLHGRA